MSNAPERIAIPDLEKKLEGKTKPVVIDVRKQADIDESGAVARRPSYSRRKSLPSVCRNYRKTRSLPSIAEVEDEPPRAAQAAWDAGHRSVSYFGLRDWKKRGLPTSKTAKKF
jgi:rhodanese-related sulfurtransferase